MLTLQIPMLLALLGTALMAVVIFAPSRLAAPVTTLVAPPPFPRSPIEAAVANQPSWPALIDLRAAACDVTARLELVEALGSVRTPWAQAILCRALDDEPEPAVRDAVSAALGPPAAGASPRASGWPLVEKDYLESPSM